MNNCFISVVNAINSIHDTRQLNTYLANIYPILKEKFSDFEIILVNNAQPVEEISAQINPLPEDLKKNIYLLNLSSPVNKNHAVIAGLDRANGDYTVLFQYDFKNQPQFIEQLYQKTQEQFDIVYLRAAGRDTKLRYKYFYKIFYFILRTNSDLEIDERAHNSRIISRRALNSLLRLKENLRYMKAIYSIVGYKTGYLEVNEPIKEEPNAGFSEHFKTSLVAITSFTTFLRTLLLWIFLFSVVICLVVILNAFLVKFYYHDIFGNYRKALDGWSFLVVIMSVFFAITCLNLYVISIYLSNIYDEIKQRPLYIIESIKRY